MKRRPTALLSVAVAITVGLWMLPGGMPPRILCPSSTTPSGLTLYSHNVSNEIRGPQLVATQLVGEDVDVVLLQEADQDFVAAVQDNLAEPYTYEVQGASGGSLSLAILSRFPISGVVDTTGQFQNQNPLLVATIDHTDGELTVANVHLSAPTVSQHVARRQSELQYLTEPAFDELKVDLVVGDFNSSQAHKDFRSAITAMNGTPLQRCGLGGSWSPLAFGPGLLTLDHAIALNPSYSNGLARPSGYASSDHRAVVVTLP